MSRGCAILLFAAACGRSRFDPHDLNDTDVADAGPSLNLCGDRSGLQAASPWPAVHGCPTNAGRSEAVGPASGALASGPIGTNTARRGAVVDNQNEVYVQESSIGDLYAFDAMTGAQRWTFTDTAGSGMEPTPVLDEQGHLLITTNYGMLWCIDPASGTTLWTLQLGGSFSAPVIGPAGTVYFGSIPPWGFYAVDTVARVQKWHYDVPNGGAASTAPAVAADRVYFVDTKNSHLFALDSATGAPLFDVAVPGTAIGSPVLGVDLLYVATATNGIAAFDATTGELRWQQPVGESVVQPALLATGAVVSSTRAGSVFVLDRATGASLHGWSLGGTMVAPPVIDKNDTAYFSTDQGTFAYSVGERAVRWQSALFGPIVMGGGELVVLPQAGTFAAIGP